MSLQVLTTPEADARIREIENWRRRNRSASPNLFADELAAAFEILGHAPHIGRLYRPSPLPDTRRVLLKGTRYHVYYVPRGDQVTLVVRTFPPTASRFRIFIPVFRLWRHF